MLLVNWGYCLWTQSVLAPEPHPGGKGPNIIWHPLLEIFIQVPLTLELEVEIKRVTIKAQLLAGLNPGSSGSIVQRSTTTFATLSPEICSG